MCDVTNNRYHVTWCVTSLNYTTETSGQFTHTCCNHDRDGGGAGVTQFPLSGWIAVLPVGRHCKPAGHSCSSHWVTYRVFLEYFCTNIAGERGREWGRDPWRQPCTCVLRHCRQTALSLVSEMVGKCCEILHCKSAGCIVVQFPAEEGCIVVKFPAEEGFIEIKFQAESLLI